MQTIERNYGEQVLNGPPDRVLSLADASKYLGVSQAAIRTWKRTTRTCLLQGGQAATIRSLIWIIGIEERLLAKVQQ
jgi:hypothetical protein